MLLQDYELSSLGHLFWRVKGDQTRCISYDKHTPCATIELYSGFVPPRPDGQSIETVHRAGSRKLGLLPIARGLKTRTDIRSDGVGGMSIDQQQM